MQLRLAAALLTLALPVLAQNPATTEAENVLYKAFYLEKAERDLPGAMALYEKFLAMAPDHPKAKVAAQQQFVLLGKAGQVKEAEAFAAKWGKLIGGTPVVGPSDTGGGAGAGAGEAANPAGRGEGDAGKGGRGRGRGEGAGAGQPGGGRGATPMTPEQIKELETKLAKAKEEGKTEEVAQLERQLQRARQPAGEGQGRGMRGQDGKGGQGQGRGRGGFGVFANTKKFADMTAEELTAFQTQLDQTGTMIDRMRERGNEEQAKAMEENVAAIKKALTDKKLEDAQKAFDKMQAGMRGGRGGE